MKASSVSVRRSLQKQNNSQSKRWLFTKKICKLAITYWNKKLLIEGITFWITFHIKCSESTASQSLSFQYPSSSLLPAFSNANLSACWLLLNAVLQYVTDLAYSPEITPRALRWNATMHKAYEYFHKKEKVGRVDNTLVEFYFQYHFRLHYQRLKMLFENFLLVCLVYTTKVFKYKCYKHTLNFTLLRQQNIPTIYETKSFYNVPSLISSSPIKWSLLLTLRPLTFH